jgi:hypothetical protein
MRGLPRTQYGKLGGKRNPKEFQTRPTTSPFNITEEGGASQARQRKEAGAKIFMTNLGIVLSE